ncbi:MAG: hypothetical protein J7K68_05690 [Candidatus Diapherotrites archaeon]|nr:hypothetical protein [Candidatus Diapherotrites archaeon]
MKVARIARIELTDEEKVKFEEDMKEILKWASQLHNLKQIRSDLRKEGYLRDDRVEKCEDVFTFSGRYVKARKYFDIQ